MSRLDSPALRNGEAPLSPRLVEAQKELMMSARANDQKGLLAALAAGADPLRTSNNGDGPLEAACEFCSFECAQILLPLTDQPDNYRFLLRPAASAARHDALDCLRLLLEAAQASHPGSLGEIAGKAAHAAAASKRLGALSLCLAFGADLGYQDRMTGQTPFTAAAYAGFLDGVLLLLQAEPLASQEELAQETLNRLPVAASRQLVADWLHRFILARADQRELLDSLGSPAVASSAPRAL